MKDLVSTHRLVASQVHSPKSLLTLGQISTISARETANRGPKPMAEGNERELDQLIQIKGYE